ncbi:hypothetical protein SAMN02745911_1191 [Aureimonas altamirensis DSM 21988]|uniref:Uncharacterized protein n=2 Tax=Aureimonas altamirensis TaxID=370622 RepID=A0A0P0YXA7_9HYPH|nr:hypothetical protein [Aureimonas altamirensis]BAT26046.1 hypothetical protein [Aureimonas altamirensis]SHI79560.1 hypothetical protein SAMN02745911_1191 [Aureimonas altamirensis DSM 21988]
MNELSQDAALVADVMLIVRARFVEAMDTLAQVDVKGLKPSAVRSLWPAFPGETIGGHHVGYGTNGSQVRYRPSSAAISRSEEVMHQWLLDYVPEEEHRVLITRWAGSLATPKWSGSFRGFCEKSGRSRSTAERHLYVAFQRIAIGLLKSAKLLHSPDWSRVVPMLPKSGTDFDNVADRVADRQYAWIKENARPADRPDLRDFSYADKRNERRRRMEKDRAA